MKDSRIMSRSWAGCRRALAWAGLATIAMLLSVNGSAKLAAQEQIRPVSCVCDEFEPCRHSAGDLAGRHALADPWGMLGELSSAVEIGGWTQLGYHTNNNGLINSRPHEVQLQQQWFHFEKMADGQSGLDWGFRFDAVYGTDGQDWQSCGSSPAQFDNPWDHGPDYGWAFPQLFFEAAWGNTSVKIGHFATPIGYEYGMAPMDFFYSHTYTFYYAEPFTHTGVMASHAVSESTEITVGWVDGWNTAFEFTGGSQFIGGIQQEVSDAITLNYVLQWGERERGMGPTGYGYNHSFVIESALTNRLESVLQHDLVDYAAIGAHDYGLNQRFMYEINEMFRVGVRGEWWHTSTDGGGNSDIYALTLGLNVRPEESLVIRPEVRWDWNADGARGISQSGLDGPINQLNGDVTFAIDAVLQY